MKTRNTRAFLRQAEWNRLRCSYATAPCLRRYVKIHLIPLDASRACAFYCCTALEPQSQMSFNEGFCIPVPANTLAVCALQLCVCSLGPQAQEELLVGPNAPTERDGSRTAAS